jgi:hypothetical protein
MQGSADARGRHSSHNQSEHQGHLKHNVAKRQSYALKHTISTRKEWEEHGGMIIRKTFKLLIGGAIQKKGRSERVTDERSVHLPIELHGI